jgi:hypothetical protein
MAEGVVNLHVGVKAVVALVSIRLDCPIARPPLIIRPVELKAVPKTSVGLPRPR